ncbi:putative ABC transport system permease protein [Arboricoccus pini]|uniref:Putative ABC transport system permease protein n=1 Tax=Arboricoccus pini TaxID=1963835 RepID=A0A212Q8V8_9PROT|nr:FtsX-like permease family protein [Arboricoccus pini]SNB55730.1 putative ABC transport system permease protein [Arboricoccus pini]
MLRPFQILKLALADLLDEWPVSLAACLAITAVVAPMLVILGLREGIVGQIFASLRADPAIRLVTLDATGSARFDDYWFTTHRAWPEVGFLHPATRFAAAQGAVAKEDDATHEERASLLPSDVGDPVFPPSSPSLADPFAVKLSADLADRLGVAKGDRLRLVVERQVAGGRLEPIVLTLTTTEIAPSASFGGRAVFARFDLLMAIEDFRDGFTVPLLNVTTGQPATPRSYYPNFRLYARDLQSVEPLVQKLRAEGLSVSAQTARIASAINLDTNLTSVVQALAILGILGLGGGLAAIQWSMAARKRRTIALFGLMGFPRSWLIGFPTAQALLVGLAGGALTIVAALAFAYWINAHLAASLGAAGRACVLTPGLMGGCLLVILTLSILPALRIGWKFATLEPAHEIREA